MAVPTYSVKVGWSSAQSGLLVFDYSTFQTINGVVQTADQFGNAYSTFFSGAQDDITEDVVSVKIRRGRDDILSQMNAGTAEVQVMRPSDRGYWNPANKSSLLNSANAPGFVPMRPIRIQATDPATSTTYGLFWGFLRSARFDYASGICTLSCVDLFMFLSRTNVLDPALSTTQGGTAYTPDTATASDVSSATVSSTSRTGLARLA